MGTNHIEIARRLPFGDLNAFEKEIRRRPSATEIVALVMFPSQSRFQTRFTDQILLLRR